MLEQKFQKKIRKHKFQQAILASVKIAGLISVAVLAPNVLKALKIPISEEGYKNEIRATRARLIKNGLLIYENGNLRLTEKGERLLEKIERYDYKINKPKKWDGHWRIIIFDIPEKRRSIRVKLVKTISEIGFKKLQNSVWIYPYDCEDLITLLKADFKIGKDILYIIASHVEYDLHLKKYFALK